MSTRTPSGGGGACQGCPSTKTRGGPPPQASPCARALPPTSCAAPIAAIRPTTPPLVMSSHSLRQRPAPQLHIAPLRETSRSAGLGRPQRARHHQPGGELEQRLNSERQ